MIVEHLQYWWHTRSRTFRIIGFGILATLVCLTTVSGTLLYNFYSDVKKGLPDASKIKNLELSLPSQVFAADGTLIGEIFSEKRYPIKIEEIDIKVRNAFIAAEDANFYGHSGIDYGGVLRAVGSFVTGSGTKQGGSTITQQLAKNFLLTREKTLTRKLKDMLLAREIEQILTKNEILELYLNSIFLGNNSYGVEAAARNYFGKSARDLSLAQAAMIAGLTPAPSAYAPTANMTAAKNRQRYVFGQMVRWGMITQEQAAAALAEEIVVTRAVSPNGRVAPYFLAEVKKKLSEVLDPTALETGGYTILTTLDSGLQKRGDEILKKYVSKFSDKKGFKGPIKRHGEDYQSVLQSLMTQSGEAEEEDAVRAVVVDLDPDLDAAIIVSSRGPGLLLAEDHTWALNVGRFKTNQIMDFANILRVGDEIHVRPLARKSPKRIAESKRPSELLVSLYSQFEGSKHERKLRFYELTDVEQIEAGLILTDGATGAIKVLIGGSDFGQSQFNRVTQARRQVGSSVKPLYYSLAFDQGFGLASQIESPPVVIGDWKPENYSRNLLGRKTLRSSLAQSYNLPSIQLFQALGILQAAAHVRMLGLDFPDRDLSAALGSSSATLLELTQAYSPFVRAGEIKESYLIEKIVDRNGQILFDKNSRELLPAPLELLAPSAKTAAVGMNARQIPSSGSSAETRNSKSSPAQVLSPAAAYLTFVGLESAVNIGTATQARIPGVRVAGKTGTTNGYTDAWFIGMVPGLVCGTWVGFDDAKKSLGTGATGGAYAAPLWREFMVEVLKVLPPTELALPGGMATARMDPETGSPVVGDKAGIEIPVAVGLEPGSSELRHALGTYGGDGGGLNPSENRISPEESEGSQPNLRSLF